MASLRSMSFSLRLIKFNLVDYIQGVFLFLELLWFCSEEPPRLFVVYSAVLSSIGIRLVRPRCLVA